MYIKFIYDGAPNDNIVYSGNAKTIYQLAMHDIRFKKRYSKEPDTIIIRTKTRNLKINNEKN